jgi:hypothetical protein
LIRYPKQAPRFDLQPPPSGCARFRRAAAASMMSFIGLQPPPSGCSRPPLRRRGGDLSRRAAVAFRFGSGRRSLPPGSLFFTASAGVALFHRFRRGRSFSPPRAPGPAPLPTLPPPASAGRRAVGRGGGRCVALPGLVAHGDTVAEFAFELRDGRQWPAIAAPPERRNAGPFRRARRGPRRLSPRAATLTCDSARCSVAAQRRPMAVSPPCRARAVRRVTAASLRRHCIAHCRRRRTAAAAGARMPQARPREFYTRAPKSGFFGARKTRVANGRWGARFWSGDWVLGTLEPRPPPILNLVKSRGEGLGWGEGRGEGLIAWILLAMCTDARSSELVFAVRVDRKRRPVYRLRLNQRSGDPPGSR